MDKAAEIIQAISHTSSYNDKLSLLANFAAVPHLKDILRFIYNPYLKTGISKHKLEKALALAPDETPYIGIDDVIKYFSTHTTGTDQDLLFASSFIRSTGLYHKHTYARRLAMAMVSQELKIGITATSLNAVYGAKFIPKISCILGKDINDVGIDRVKWPCIVTEKLDGHRRILIKENKVCRFFTRSGHEDFGLAEIAQEAKLLPNNAVYDGELIARGRFKDNIALRQATGSIATSKGTKSGLVFCVFDMMPLAAFKGEGDAAPALDRKILLGATFMDESIQHLTDNWASLIAAFGLHQQLNFIRPLPILGKVSTFAEVEPIVADIWRRSGEGVMLNTVDGLYELKRSSSLLKVKFSKEYILTVVDMVEGNGKYEGMLGALIINYNGTSVGVGSGFSDAQRRIIWDERDLFIGAQVEIETFGESTNAAGGTSLNCPIFKRFVDEE